MPALPPELAPPGVKVPAVPPEELPLPVPPVVEAPPVLEAEPEDEVSPLVPAFPPVVAVPPLLLPESPAQHPRRPQTGVGWHCIELLNL